jgi:hypothetical protein
MLAPCCFDPLSQPLGKRSHAGGERDELAIPRPFSAVSRAGAAETLLLTRREAAVVLLHAEKLRAGGGHAEAGWIGRPNASDEWLYEAIEHFPSESAQRERLE